MRFYKTGVDITNDKQMFNFLKGHTTYYTANSWNGLESVAHNVKLYNLGLSGDWGTAYNLLANGEYDTLNCMIQQWCEDHRGFEVYFNGRSGGYLVLTPDDHYGTMLPDDIEYCDNYDEYKSYCKEYYGSVKANRSDLVFYTKLVRDFDKLCDQLREYCDELSNQSFEIMEMQKAVEEFNDYYAPDLEYLEFQCLRMDAEGCVDVSEICQLNSLYEAFLRVADRKKVGYTLEPLPDWRVRYKKM